MKGEPDPRTRSGPQILWGRVAFFAVTLVLAFALGAWSAADDTADAELQDARAEIERLSQENANLRAEKQALEAGEALDAEAASDESDDDGSDASGPEQPDDSRAAAEDDEVTEDGSAADADAQAGTSGTGDSEVGTYVVRQGDTGMDIAEAVYGDRDLWPLIADANDLDGANALQVDQELVIPPAE